ncbi:hypothetical protein AB0L99_12675 [Streptomyces sp. NPDC051954]|uniref:hypothetical protein n=1 Tax=Streptomyces sp. NPDC051954 TaxID=3155524 RepID=UPI00343E54F3
MDQSDAFGESGCCEPGSLHVRLDSGPFVPDEVVKEFGSVDESVVAVREAGPESAGDVLTDVDQGWVVLPTKAPVALLGSNDVGGAGQVELLLWRVDVLTDPELVADADVVVDGRPDLSRKRRAGARDDAAAASPAKHVAIGDRRQVRMEVVGLEVGDRAGQVLSGLTAEDAEDIEAGEPGSQPA